MQSDFRDLDVWKKGQEIRKYIFDLTKKLPSEENFRLADQMIRASRSITANIAEGYGRYHYQDNIRFCRQARGSLYELFDHFEVALECKYIAEQEYTRINKELKEIMALINGYVKYLSTQKLLNKSTT